MLAKTTFEVQRTDKEGKVETVKGVLESTSSIQGMIHLENAANNMSLDVHCKKPIHINSKVAIVDENELMKDSSKETIPSICNPYPYYKSCVVKEIIGNSRDEANFHEDREREESAIFDENEYFDVIEYKTPPASQGSGSCWRDSSSSSVGVSAIHLKDANSSILLFENAEETERTDNVKKQEHAFSQLVCINKSLKLVTSRVDSMLKIPGGKASVINALQEMYKSLFSKNNV